MVQERRLDDYYIQYQNLPFEGIQEHFRKLAIIGHIDASHVKTALEVGCGRRSIFCDYKEFENVTIVDPIQEFLNKAEEDLSSSKTYLHPICSTIETAEIGEECFFETIIVSSLLHEVSEPRDILLSVKRYMDIDSELIVVVNNRDSIHRVLAKHLGILESLDGITETNMLMQQKLGVFSMDSLNSLLVSCGFKVEILETFMPKLLPHATLQEALDAKVISMSFLEELFRLGKQFPTQGSEIIAKARLAV